MSLAAFSLRGAGVVRDASPASAGRTDLLPAPVSTRLDRTSSFAEVTMTLNISQHEHARIRFSRSVLDLQDFVLRCRSPFGKFCAQLVAHPPSDSSSHDLFPMCIKQVRQLGEQPRQARFDATQPRRAGARSQLGGGWGDEIPALLTGLSVPKWFAGSRRRSKLSRMAQTWLTIL